MTIAEKIEFLLWEKRGQEVERNSVADEFRCTSIDVLDAYEREVLVTCFRRLDLTGYSISCLESMLLDLILRDIDVIR